MSTKNKTKIKNKHGRTGTKKYRPRVPLSDQQRTEVRERASAEGWVRGQKSGMVQALALVNSSKSIREARRRLEEMVASL